MLVLCSESAEMKRVAVEPKAYRRSAPRREPTSGKGA